uniref:Uncharacterized protein n=1 Tax=Syphacia muris TaxID=451379 RepID=A0A0N5ANI9_9BILA
MVGHRRDQSDSNIPLRQCSEFHLCPSATGSQDLSLHIDQTAANVFQNGVLASNLLGHLNDVTSWNQRQEISSSTPKPVIIL